MVVDVEVFGLIVVLVFRIFIVYFNVDMLMIEVYVIMMRL